MATSFSCHIGNENQNDGQCEMRLFLVPEGQSKEIHLGLAASAKEAESFGLSVTNRKMDDAVAGLPDIGGKWTTLNLQINDGVILKLYAKRKGSWNSLQEQGCMYIQIREKAAHRRIRMDTLQKQNKSRFLYTDIEGRFDLLSVSEVRELRTVDIKPQFERMYLPSSVAFLNVQELQPEIAKREQLVTKVIVHDDGEETRIRVRTRVRKLNLSVRKS